MRCLMVGILALAAGLQAAPKQVLSYVRVTASTPVYHGASDSSQVDGQAAKGQVYAVVDEKQIHGFYKIDVNGHVSYIPAGFVTAMDEKGSPVPTEKPTVEAAPSPTPRGFEASEGGLGDEEGRKPTPKPSATAVSDDDEELQVRSGGCTLKKGASEDDEDEAELPKGARLVLKDKSLHNGYYRCEYKGKTVYVKAEHCDRVKKEPVISPRGSFHAINRTLRSKG